MEEEVSSRLASCEFHLIVMKRVTPLSFDTSLISTRFINVYSMGVVLEMVNKLKNVLKPEAAITLLFCRLSLLFVYLLTSAHYVLVWRGVEIYHIG